MSWSTSRTQSCWHPGCLSRHHRLGGRAAQMPAVAQPPAPASPTTGRYLLPCELFSA